MQRCLCCYLPHGPRLLLLLLLPQLRRCRLLRGLLLPQSCRKCRLLLLAQVACCDCSKSFHSLVEESIDVFDIVGSIKNLL